MPSAGVEDLLRASCFASLRQGLKLEHGADLGEGRKRHIMGMKAT